MHQHNLGENMLYCSTLLRDTLRISIKTLTSRPSKLMRYHVRRET